MATCGNCKQENMTIDHIKGCFQERYSNVATSVEEVKVSPIVETYAAAEDFRPMALTLPDSKYAIEREDGPVFFEVRHGRKGRWVGVQFIDRLVGAPGDWRRFPIKGQAKKDISAELLIDPAGAAARFGHLFKKCAVCNSPLSDAESLERGIGPICAKRF